MQSEQHRIMLKSDSRILKDLVVLSKCPEIFFVVMLIGTLVLKCVLLCSLAC